MNQEEGKGQIFQSLHQDEIKGVISIVFGWRGFI